MRSIHTLRCYYWRWSHGMESLRVSSLPFLLCLWISVLRRRKPSGISRSVQQPRSQPFTRHDIRPQHTRTLWRCIHELVQRRGRSREQVRATQSRFALGSLNMTTHPLEPTISILYFQCIYLFTVCFYVMWTKCLKWRDLRVSSARQLNIRPSRSVSVRV